MKLIRNFLAGIGCLTVLVVLLVAAWLYRDEIRSWWSGRGDVVSAEISPELAEAVEQKLNALVRGDDGPELRLSETELQSWVRYRLLSQLPDGVYDPTVVLRDTTVRFTAALDFERLASSSGAAEGLQRIMGDSARVKTEIYPRVAAEGRGEATVLSLQAGVVPVPPMFIPNVLKQAGFESNGRTVVFPVPVDLAGIRIRNDQLILVRRGADGGG
ncbi:MAG: hypothetical protein ACE5HQ_06645 [Gemmatimonadota bacterium]